MNKTTKKLLSGYMAALMLIASLASCNTDPAPTLTDPAATASTLPETTTAKNTEITQSNLKTDLVFTDLGITDHAELSRLAATEGMVLLENKNSSLPLKKGSTVAVFGKGQIDFYKGGTGSGDVNAPYVINLLEGLKNKAKEGKISIYQPLANQYLLNSSYTPNNVMYSQAASASDTAIVVISRNTGEMYDRKNSNGDYGLSPQEQAMISSIISAGFENICVVLNVPAIVDVSFMEKYPEIDSLLLAWQPGMEGGNAVADILCGDANPSGKLTDTITTQYKHYPTAMYFNKIADREQYSEDIYIGYRYFETFDPNYEKVKYEFGYGLSYTTFSIDNVKFECDGLYIRITADIKNVGSVAGKEVVQVYYSAPQGELGNPARELAAYAKTKLLAPGESETVVMSFAVSDMADYDDVGHVAKAAYVLLKGDYKFFVGNSVKDASLKGVRYTYTVKENKITQQLTTQMQPDKLTKRLKADGTTESLPSYVNGIEISKASVIESGEYYSASHPVVYTYSGTSDMVTGISSLKENESLVYNLICPQDGEYKLVLYLAATGNTKFDDGLYVRLQDNTKIYLDYTCSGGLGKLAATEEIVLNLKKGNNIITLLNNNINKTFIFSHMIISAPGHETSELEYKKEITAFPKNDKTVTSFVEVYNNPDLLDEFVNGLTINELTELLVGHSATVSGGTGTIGALSALDVPGANTADGPAGLRLSQPQTAWPIGTLMACTYNLNLVYNVGVAIGQEMLNNNVDIWLAPGMNIHRDPLCGRNFEYYSEDPYVTGMTASAITLGVQSKGVGVMIKHFALNNRETNRFYCDSRCSERAIREIYLKGFEICVKTAEPWAIMSSYNKINGIWASENEDLLTNILRGEWGFEGIVSTDWGNKAGKFREVGAGNDVSMPGGDTNATKAAYYAGYITLEDLRNSATRILKTVLKSPAMKKVADPEAVLIPKDKAVRIKAVDWVKKADRIGSEVCEDVDGGNNPKFTEVNTFLTYRVEAEAEGKYLFSFRLASPNGNGAFDLYVDGKKIGNYKIGKNTGGWQSWATFEDVLSCDLSEGKHDIRIQFTAEQININWFEIEKNN
ncbi:MAG: carbohydrate-binding protein [Ruminococcaceae bacterium]|nr:carbohydrate-binding protein [Oscillospiraceae bacterium]